MINYINFFIKFIGDIFKAMQSMYIVPGVSLFYFIVAALIVITIVICVFH